MAVATSEEMIQSASIVNYDMEAYEIKMRKLGYSFESEEEGKSSSAVEESTKD